MEKKLLYIALIITQVLLMGYPSYGATAEVSKDPPMLSEMEQALKAIDEALAQQTEQGDTNINKRVDIRSKARATESKAQGIKKTMETITSPLATIGTAAGLIATASGDYHAKVATAIFRLSITAVNGLGTSVASIVIGISRYRERSQEILSITELLVEDLRKSIDKIKALQKKQEEILDIVAPSKPSESASGLKRFAQKLYNAPATIHNKVREVTEVMTNAKGDRETKLKGIQDDLKKEKEHFSEIIKLLQIKLLQDAVKEIDKKINLDTMRNMIKFKDDDGIEKEKVVTVYGTIDKLKNDIKFYNESKDKISTKSKSEAEKQRAEIDEKLSKAQKDLDFYVDFQKNIKENDKRKLEEDKKKLIGKINELTQLTKMGSTPKKEERDIANTLSKTDIDYLQSKKANISNPDANKQTIIALWTTIANLYREIDTLKKGGQSPRGSLPPIPLPRPNQNNGNNQQSSSAAK